MRHHLTAIATILISACAISHENTMNINPLSVSIECKDNPECFFYGENIPITISIKNDGASDIELPLIFMQKTGPNIKLIDTKKNRSTFLKRNLADPALRKTLTKIAPGKSVSIDWILINTEIEQFDNTSVDLTVEVTVQSLNNKKLDGEPETLNSSGHVRIVSKSSK
jgi:hypothetical protein